MDNPAKSPGTLIWLSETHRPGHIPSRWVRCLAAEIIDLRKQIEAKDDFIAQHSKKDWGEGL